MTTRTHLPHPITIDQPMVLVSAEEYQELLKEAGYASTPKLDQEIAQARASFRKGRIVSWEALKDELR